MPLVVDSPCFVRLDLQGESLERVKKFLVFNDRSVQFLLAKHSKNRRWKEADEEAWLARYDELKKQVKRNICFEDERGFFTYSGLAGELAALTNEPIVWKVLYPAEHSLAWAKVPEHEPRYYQDQAKNDLLSWKHAAISLPTGSGKSHILRDLVHDIGLRALVMAPTQSIAAQLYEDFVEAFGKRVVGMYGDGKKELKHVTIAIAASLARVKPGSEAEEHFRGVQVFAADESHMCPAATLENVCVNLVRNAPYRLFVSATQKRNDGAELVLRGVTGPLVYEKSLQELVDAGFLAKPLWKVVVVDVRDDHFMSDNPQKMVRHYVYQNGAVYKQAARIANGVIRKYGHRVLILVDELAQFPMLLPYFREGDVRFAHGAPFSNKDMRKVLPTAYWRSEPNALVKAFDHGEFPVLVGTSCISMGTDVKSPETVINLRGGTSVIDIPQAVGRGTRLFTFPDGHKKTSFNYVDFDVRIHNEDVDDGNPEARMSLIHRHAISRVKMLRDLYPGDIQWIQ